MPSDAFEEAETSYRSQIKILEEDKARTKVITINRFFEITDDPRLAKSRGYHKAVSPGARGLV
jgi:hypothetical protein